MNAIPLPGLFLFLLFLILFSGFFSGSETALMTLNRYRLRHRAEQGHKGALLARALLARPDRLIGLILLGNNFVNILASALATIIALRLGGEGAIAVATGLLTLVILIFAEVLPKTLAATYPERLAYPAAFLYTPLLKLLYPLVRSVNWVTNGILHALGAGQRGEQDNALSREELRTLLSEAGAMIPQRSQTMLLAILDLGKVTVEDIMIPRNEVDGIDIRDPEEEIIDRIKNAAYTRLPLFDGDIDNVIGIIHVRDALHTVLDRGLDKEYLREIGRRPYFVPEGTPLYQQLLNFQREKEPVGLVVDEYGDVLGLTTLTDLLEEIVGEFASDPAQTIAEIHQSEDGSLLIDCGISVRELNRALRWKLPTGGPKTLNGLIIEHMEAIPEPGTSLKLGGYAIEIIHTAESAVKTVKYARA
ncbi:MAG: HlyC/CorC family transporter [Candidatus Thiosymbion ectosymbiont of Robbea hypermnestra]|nr:HlyC/CorC family transporter [Candidatus Thiosymbion ectosymbiont of Robbea hypermnestra]